MNKEVILSLKNVNVVFSKVGKYGIKEHNFHVLKNINLDIHAGEIIAIVGESGCGKTTLGKIITGLLKPSKGEVKYRSNNVYGFFKKDFQTFRNDVQFIQQDSYAALNPVRTIFQSLYAPIRAHHHDYSREQINKRIEELLGLVGLLPAEQFLDKYPHQLSGGQRQRILMARALSLSPKLIVADEPVSMIDVSMRLSILKLMANLNRELDIAFVYITHDLGTAKFIADEGNVAVMYLGQIVEYGPIRDFIQQPLHPYSQALISAVPIPDPQIARQIKEIKIKGMEMSSLENRNSGCPFYARCPYCHLDCKDDKKEYLTVGKMKVLCPYYEEILNANKNI
ncbi:MAG: ABC transporter ATP-binding protein [Bacilli bacterium]|jgi:peptide/nickel transport system ATP-binding protein|nr:ABC transporter ATP-binding protein [Bacilli bacterium]